MTTYHKPDPSANPDPERLDGRRYLPLRERPGNQFRYNMVKPNEEILSWGCGAHTCPGRGFTSNKTKIMRAHSQAKYDWKFKACTCRPKNRPALTGNSNRASRVGILYKSRQGGVEFGDQF